MLLTFLSVLKTTDILILFDFSMIWTNTTCNFHFKYLSFFFPIGARVFLTIALDLVISSIHEPVRFLIEAKARVCVLNSKGDILSQDISDTFLSPFKKLSPFTEDFDMILKEVKILIFIN